MTTETTKKRGTIVKTTIDELISLLQVHKASEGNSDKIEFTGTIIDKLNGNTIILTTEKQM